MMCARCEELEEEVRQLKDNLYGRGWHAPPEMRLTKQEEAFLACLLAHPGVRNHAFVVDAISHGNTEVDTRLSQVIACKVRRKTRPFGIEIETVWSSGYRMPEASRQRLLNWQSQQAA
jgi:two-component system cell cycle response regulator CtrA